MAFFVKAVLILVGLVNLAPVVGVLSQSHLFRLYGVAIENQDLLLMMRHRAVLLGLVGATLVAAAWLPGLRTAACILGLVSMISFVVLVLGSGGVGAPLLKIAVIDGVAIVVLVLALAAHLRMVR